MSLTITPPAPGRQGGTESRQGVAPVSPFHSTLETPGTNGLRDAHAALDFAVRAASRMSATEDTLAFLLALNLELAEEGAKGYNLRRRVHLSRLAKQKSL